MNFIWCLCLLCSVRVVSTNLFLSSKDVITFNNTEELYAKWRVIEKNLRNGVDSVLRYILPLLARADADLNITEKCSVSILTTVSALREYKPWAYRMMDASGKIPSGIFTGTVSEYGSYDQCLSVRVEDERNSTAELFTGQYCILELTPPLPDKPASYWLHRTLPDFANFTPEIELIEQFVHVAHLGYSTPQQIAICVPSLCTKEDVTQIITLVETGLHVTVPTCEVTEEYEFRLEHSVIIAVTGFVVLLVLLGTVIDKIATVVVGKTDESLKVSDATAFERVVAAFSFDSNLKNLVRTDPENPLNILNGLRFISVTWVIVAQTYSLTNWQFLRNLYPMTENIKTIAFQAVANAYVSVDTLFFIGGVLACYGTVKIVDKSGKEAFSVLIFMLHRLWRYLPGFLLVIGLTLFLPLIGSGPVWHQTIDSTVNNCRKKFWSNLILANNFISIPDACLPHSWYSAVDFQLYQLVPLFFLFLFKRQLFGIIFIVVLLIGSVVSVGVINALKGYPPAPLASLPDIDNQVDLWQNLNKAHPYMAPYAIGLAVGLILARNPTFSISVFLQILGWPLAIICNLAVLYGTYRWNVQIDPSDSIVESTLYAALHRTIWAVGIGWLTLMCASGRGGPINTILSWGCFVPLSRLTHLAYLLHYLVILVYMGNLRGKFDAHNMVLAWLAIGNVAVTFALAFVCHLLVEAPLLEVFDIMIGHLRRISCRRRRMSKHQNGALGDKEMTIPKKVIATNTVASEGIVNSTFDEHL